MKFSTKTHINNQLADSQWRPLLEAATTNPSSYDARQRFIELNPHLKNDQKFMNRYDYRKSAAVLIPIVMRAEPTILLTVRSDDMPTHAGQISFPGGGVQKEDHNHEAAALRETQEEVGIDPKSIDILGDIGVHYGGMGFKVTPFVGLLKRDVQCVACPREVQEIFEVPLSYVLDLENHKTVDKVYNNISYKVFTIPYKDYNIWGLTAGMLLTLAERVKVVISSS